MTDKKCTTAQIEMDAVVDFIWSDVVIGADIEAVNLAYENEFHIIKNRKPHHHSYENVEHVWAERLYYLYQKGLCPFVDKVKSLRVDPEKKIIKVLTNKSAFLINYTNVHIFDDTNVSGVSLDRELLHYRVIDWFDCRGLRGMEEITTKDKFVNKITFFKSRRLDGNQPYLDLLCESFLTQEQLKSFDYSDTMARFKVADLLKKQGAGSVRLALWKRDVFPVYR